MDNNIFEGFSDESKVWLYQSDRALTEQEMNELENELKKYTHNWDSHGSLLVATAKVVNPYMAMIVVDQTKVGLCGGSIDSKTRFVKELGQRFGVNFFNRMNVTIQEGDETKQIHFSDLKGHKDALIFDPLVTTLGDFRKAWPRPIAESHFSHLV